MERGYLKGEMKDKICGKPVQVTESNTLLDSSNTQDDELVISTDTSILKTNNSEASASNHTCQQLPLLEKLAEYGVVWTSVNENQAAPLDTIIPHSSFTKKDNSTSSKETSTKKWNPIKQSKNYLKTVQNLKFANVESSR